MNSKCSAKNDRAKYLPLLIQANVGLTREMLVKGLVSEAQPVLAYLKTIAAPAELQSLELEFALKSGDGGRQIACFIPLLVGGATRTPMVHRLLQERMGIEPQFEINPDLIVAMGAAVQAGVLAGEQRHSILVDITPPTLSTAALESYQGWDRRIVCVPIIPRNTSLPASKAEQSWSLRHSETAARLAFLAASALGETARAVRWHRVASE